MKDLLLITTFTDNTKQVLVESAESIYNRVVATKDNNNVAEMLVFENGKLIFSK